MKICRCTNKNDWIIEPADSLINDSLDLPSLPNYVGDKLECYGYHTLEFLYVKVRIYFLSNGNYLRETYLVRVVV